MTNTREPSSIGPSLPQPPNNKLGTDRATNEAGPRCGCRRRGVGSRIWPGGATCGNQWCDHRGVSCGA